MPPRSHASLGRNPSTAPVRGSLELHAHSLGGSAPSTRGLLEECGTGRNESDGCQAMLGSPPGAAHGVAMVLRWSVHTDGVVELLHTCARGRGA